MTTRFNRGGIVRPNAAALALTRFGEASRLVVRVCSSGRWCVACLNARRVGVRVLHESEGRPVYAHQLRRAAFGVRHLIEPGALYAAGKEQTSSLCLDHVELVEGQR